MTPTDLESSSSSAPLSIALPLHSLLDDNASTSPPCACLPPPPDFDLPPPPLLPSVISDHEFAAFLSSDSYLQSCHSDSSADLSSNIGDQQQQPTLTVPAWMNNDDEEISVTKSNGLANSMVTIFGVASGVGAVVLILFVVLVVYYCRRKRSPSTDQLICLHGLNRRSPQSNVFANTSRNRPAQKSHSMTKFSQCQQQADGRLYLAKDGLSARNTSPPNDDEIRVGANWTFRRAKSGDFGQKPPTSNDEAIYDVPHALPKLPPLPNAYPDALCASAQSSYDNHNPVYEEISIHGEYDPSKLDDQHIYSECSNRNNYSSYSCKDCANGATVDGVPRRQCRHRGLQDTANGGPAAGGEQSGLATGSRRAKRCYTNGSLAVSLAEGFEINVEQSAFV